MTAGLQHLSNLLRRFGGVFFSSLLSLGVLVLVGFLLPRSVTPEVFGEWRKVVLAMVPVGVVHLGMADALFKVWTQRAAGPLGVGDIVGYVQVIMVVSVLYTGVVHLIGLLPGDALWLFLAFAILSGLHAVLLSRLLAQQTRPFFVLRYSAQPITLLLLLAAWLAQDQPTVIGLLAVYVMATGLAALVLVPGAVVRGPQALPGARQLILDMEGVKILVSNLLFLALINVDKFVLSFDASLVDFANYNLMSTVVFASGTIFSQVGTAVYAQGVLGDARTKVVLIGTVTVAFLTLFATWSVLARPMAALFPGYDLRLFAFFLPASALMSIISVYHMPLLKYSHPQAISALTVTTIGLYVAIFFALKWFGEQALLSSILSYSVALVFFAISSEVWTKRGTEVREAA